MDKHIPKHENFEAYKAIKPLRKLVDEVAKVTFKPIKKDLVYKGPEILSTRLLACGPNIKDGLTKQNLDYDNERGRDAIEMLLWKAYQLGFSVGYENCYTEHAHIRKLVDKLLKED